LLTFKPRTTIQACTRAAADSQLPTRHYQRNTTNEDLLLRARRALLLCLFHQLPSFRQVHLSYQRPEPLGRANRRETENPDAHRCGELQAHAATREHLQVVAQCPVGENKNVVSNKILGTFFNLSEQCTPTFHSAAGGSLVPSCLGTSCTSSSITLPAMHIMSRSITKSFAGSTSTGQTTSLKR